MYHQLQKIGEEGLLAEIEYTIGDPDDEIPTITKITIGEAVIPVGAFPKTPKPQLSQIYPNLIKIKNESILYSWGRLMH